jgi:hypothetical protein
MDDTNNDQYDNNNDNDNCAHVEEESEGAMA